MRYTPTELNVSPPTVQIAEADERAFTFDGDPDDDETITGATAELVRYDSGATVGTGVAGGAVTGSITAMSITDEVASVRVDNLLQPIGWYELRVTFTTSANVWTRTLGIKVVA